MPEVTGRFRRRAIVTLLLLQVALQTLLIYYGQFSSFDREMNWLSVFAGARPAPVFWAVALADLAAWWLFLWVLRLTAPGRLTAPTRLAGDGGAPGSAPLRTPGLTRPYLALTAAWLLFNHFLWAAMVQIFRPGPTLRWLALALLIAGALTLLFAVRVAAGGDARLARRGLRRHWLLVPLAALLTGLLLALDYFLLAIPLLGDVLRAAADTLIKLGFFLALARLVGNGDVAGQGQAGTAGATVNRAYSPGRAARRAVAAAALAGLMIALLPGPRAGTDPVPAPPLVIQPPAATPVSVRINGDGVREDGYLEGGGFRVNLREGGAALTVQDAAGKALLDLATPVGGRPAGYSGLSLSRVAYDFRLIPLFWTGNTMKSALTLSTTPLAGLHLTEGSGPVPGSKSLMARGAEGSLEVSVYRPGVLKLVVQAAPGRRANTVAAAFTTTPEEQFLGLGERLNAIDQRGNVVYNLVEELGYGGSRVEGLTTRLFGPRGSFPNGSEGTSWPVPFLVSSRGYGLYLDANGYSQFDLAARYPDTYRVSAQGSSMTLYLFDGATPLESVGDFATLTGLPPMPQPWVFLPWKSRTGNPTERMMTEDEERLRELRIPDSVINMEGLQDIPGSYEISARRYPNLTDLLRSLKDAGYRATFWQFPYFNRGSAAYYEGLRQGYFIKNRVGLPYHLRTFFAVSCVLDYTNPAAAQWHAAKVENWLRMGFSGFMNDYGESIPPDAVFYNGQSGEAMRNLYPLLYTQTMDAAARAVRGDDYTLYPRAGYTGAQRMLTSQWPGDQSTDWDQAKGLPAALRAMLNASIAGVPFQGSDIGGFLDIVSPPTDKELFLRWAELGAYSPIMRAHGGMTHPVREPWRFDQETVDVYRRLADEHTLLFPYLYSLARDATLTGLPLMRHPSLVDPSDPRLYSVEDEYLLGDALLVAPVVQQGVTQRSVYLPAGDWVFLGDGHVYHGPDQVTVPAPLDQIPLFLRQGQMMPKFTQVFDTFDPATTPGVRQGSLNAPIQVSLFPGSGVSSFTLYNGLQLTALSRGANLELSATPAAAGATPAGQPQGATAPAGATTANTTQLVGWDLRGMGAPVAVLAEGKPLDPAAWHYDPQTYRLQVNPLSPGTRVEVRFTP